MTADFESDKGSAIEISVVPLFFKSSSTFSLSSSYLYRSHKIEKSGVETFLRISHVE